MEGKQQELWLASNLINIVMVARNLLEGPWHQASYGKHSYPSRQVELLCHSVGRKLETAR